MFWDAKNNRFLYSVKEDNAKHNFAKYEHYANMEEFSEEPVLDANVDFSTLQKSPKGMTAVFGYINFSQGETKDENGNSQELYAKQDPYFIFKDEDTGDLYRYQLTEILFEGEKSRKTRSASEEKRPTFTIQGKKLEGILPECDTSTLTYNTDFETDYLFYSDGKTIYRYDVRNGNNIPMYIAPDGYKITMMKFRLDDSNSFCNDIRRILSIGLCNETTQAGAVAEIKFNTAADLDEDFEPLFYDKDNEGNTFGKIKDLQFVYELNYKI